MASSNHTVMLEGFDQLLQEAGQPGLTELSARLRELLGADAEHGSFLDGRQLSSPHPRVYRIRFDVNGGIRSVVVKRLEPAIAHLNQLVADHWLPAVNLTDRGPKLLGAAAERAGQCVWHIYEDFGDWALAANGADPARVCAAVKLIAQVHVRFAEHPLLAECRVHGGDLGVHFYSSNVRDAIRCLESLRAPDVPLTAERAEMRDRLLARLAKLRDEEPARAEALAELGGPETLLHGDLWTTNTFVVPTPTGWHARLIDWDHAAVGPASYDLSTFLLRFPPGQRRWILDVYRAEMRAADWHLPPGRDLNLVFETAEYSRLASCVVWPALAFLRDRAEWGFTMLGEVEQWFAEMQPVLPEEDRTQTRSAVRS